MKTTSRVSLFAVMFLAFAGQARGDTLKVTEERTLPAFKAIDVPGTVDVDVAIGKDRKVEVVGTKGETQRVLTAVKNGVLTIDMNGKGMPDHVDLAVKITMPALEAVTLGGTVDFDVTGLAGGALSATVSGTAQLDLAGTLASLALAIPGTAQVNAKQLSVGAATIDVAGTAEASLRATKTLAATIGGTAVVKVYGKPVVTKTITGTGIVTMKD